jgi:hypothetical protein
VTEQNKVVSALQKQMKHLEASVDSYKKVDKTYFAYILSNFAFTSTICLVLLTDYLNLSHNLRNLQALKSVEGKRRTDKDTFTAENSAFLVEVTPLAHMDVTLL